MNHQDGQTHNDSYWPIIEIFNLFYMFGHTNCSFTTGNNHGMSAKLLDEVSTSSVDYTTPQAGRAGVEGRGATFVSMCVHVLWRAMRERRGTA